MTDYRPEKFADLAALQLGKDLWVFLNEPDNVIRMETWTWISPCHTLGLFLEIMAIVKTSAFRIMEKWEDLP